MPDRFFILTCCVMMGCAVAITYQTIQASKEFPTKEEILTAVEKGSQSTIVPVSTDN